MILLADEIRKTDAREEALRQLRRFTDSQEPTLKRFLYRNQYKLENVVTYQVIRNALLTGSINADLLKEWQLCYSIFVSEMLMPLWDKAFQAVARKIERKRKGFYFDPFNRSVQRWTENRAADFVTNCSRATQLGVRAAVRRSAYHKELGVDELAQVIRPMVGLTKPQVIANQNYYNRLLDNGVKPKVAAERAIKYAARQHRYRGMMIARTESAFAYNHANYEAVHQAIAQGYMGKTQKVWCTADDERTCGTCRDLDGQTIGLDDDFGFATRLPKSHGIRRVPPAHPHCRCTVLYEEIQMPAKRASDLK